jgi:hypothetical protein
MKNIHHLPQIHDLVRRHILEIYISLSIKNAVYLTYGMIKHHKSYPLSHYMLKIKNIM